MLLVVKRIILRCPVLCFNPYGSRLDSLAALTHVVMVAEKGIWFASGSCGNCRFFSRFIVLQIKADRIGLPFKPFQGSADALTEILQAQQDEEQRKSSTALMNGGTDSFGQKHCKNLNCGISPQRYGANELPVPEEDPGERHDPTANGYHGLVSDDKSRK